MHATTIQASLRKKAELIVCLQLQRGDDDDDDSMLSKVILCQSLIRKKTAMMRYNKLLVKRQMNAVTIQRTYRGFSKRKLYHSIVAESTQKASMVVESQNKCLSDELNEYFERIYEESSIVVERMAAIHAEELDRASHAVDKKLQEMSTLHSAELTKLSEELHFMSSERVQAEALHAAEREALERERGEAETELARAREAHAAEVKRVLDEAASSKEARDRDSERCDAVEAELASVRAQVEEAKSRNESLEAENGAAREGLMRRISELERFEADLTSLKVQFSTLTEEKDQLAMKLDDEDQCKECVVCKESRKEYAFLPCGHMCVCEGCAASIQGQDRTCPLCRGVSTSIMKIFH